MEAAKTGARWAALILLGYVAVFAFYKASSPGLRIDWPTARYIGKGYVFYLLVPVACNQRLLIPWLLRRGRRYAYLFAALGFVAAYSGLLSLAFGDAAHLHAPLIIWYTCVGTGVVLFVSKLREEREAREKELLQREQELRYLRGQMNPHFLFNALNSIYGLARAGSAETANVVMQLSELLRYALEGHTTERVRLGDELEFLNRYLLLAELRSRDHCLIEFDIDAPQTDLWIAPMLFLPVVENAVKHCGRRGPDKSHVEISARSGATGCTLKVTNTVGKKVDEDSFGIGLTNLKRRLELLYPGSHRLEIESSAENFIATLSLELPPCAA